MKTTTPGGFGPWFVGLLVNTSETSKKQTHLIAHTNPHLAVDVLNKGCSSGGGGGSGRGKKRVKRQEAGGGEEHEDDATNKKKKQDDYWVMMIKIGPFEEWRSCVNFWGLWSDKTRGKARRLERGVELFNKYGNLYGLHMWVQTRHREETIHDFRTECRHPRTDNDDGDDDDDEDNFEAQQVAPLEHTWWRSISDLQNVYLQQPSLSKVSDIKASHATLRNVSKTTKR